MIRRYYKSIKIWYSALSLSFSSNNIIFSLPDLNLELILLFIYRTHGILLIIM